MFLRGVIRIRQKHHCNCPQILSQTRVNVDYVGTDADSQADEVQRFFGWAIKEAIDHWKGRVKKVRLHNSDEAITYQTDEYKCLTFVKSMHCFHNDILFDNKYIRNCYPISVASHICGWLYLVVKPYFSFGLELLFQICLIDMAEKMKGGDCNAVTDPYEVLCNDDNLFQKFVLSVNNAGYMDNTMVNCKTEVWKYLVRKTYHACIAVITSCFAEATTGHYTAAAATNSLHTMLKIKIQQGTIEKVNMK